MTASNEKFDLGLFARLFEAVRTLTTEHNIQQRLYHACEQLIPLRVEDFPKSMQEEFRELRNGFTSEKAQADEGTLKATIDTFSNEKAGQFAQKLVSLYAKYRDYEWKGGKR